MFSLSQKEQAHPIKALISNLEGFLEEGRGRLAIVHFYWLVTAANSCCFTVWDYMLGPQSDTTQIHPGTHLWSWKMCVWKETHCILSVRIKYSLYLSPSDSLAFALQLLLLTFAKDTAGISSALKMQFFPFLDQGNHNCLPLFCGRWHRKAAYSEGRFNYLFYQRYQIKQQTTRVLVNNGVKLFPLPDGEFDHEMESSSLKGSLTMLAMNWNRNAQGYLPF